MAFELLSAPIRKYIRDKGWEQLRPIQVAAITRIMASDDNYILASKTASGKTEAAFLPILSKVDFSERGVSVLYISPLIALINDQFTRIEDLCQYMDVGVTKWHGEANQAAKKRLLKQPEGIVLITPESLEAMFVNRPAEVKHLFGNLKYVVIDEIHSFIGTDRGLQLKSILARLQRINDKTFSIVGLSATIGDYDEAKKLTGREQQTKVLLDRTNKDISAIFQLFEHEEGNNFLPTALLKELYKETKNSKTLVFPNNRGKAEVVAVELTKIAQQQKGHTNYFSHHSSVNREIREYVEHFAKNNRRDNFCIACTSTLELGIDIGTIDKVVQIDATHSIASLIQRVGRSGRQEGQSSHLFLYATKPWDLLQALACWLLYQEGFIEPPHKNNKPYHLFLHQALSVVKERSGISWTNLVQELQENAAFKQIEVAEMNEILAHLVEIDFLEKIQQELIIGVKGEEIVNSRDFYSVFMLQEDYKVVAAGTTIGALPLSPAVAPDENIMLAARMWRIVELNHAQKKIEVEPARDGKKPIFFGSASMTHPRIPEKMFEILCSSTIYDFLDNTCQSAIEDIRDRFKTSRPINPLNERLVIACVGELKFYSFTGTRINNTLRWLFEVAGIKADLQDRNSLLSLDAFTEELRAKWPLLAALLADVDVRIQELLTKRPELMAHSKWGKYLPLAYKAKLYKDSFFDVEQTKSFLNNINLVFKTV